MKKPKTTKPFYFKDKTHQEVVEEINKELPINLKYNEDLVDRVHARYPLISKSEIAIIIKLIFENFRELLILGNILNFHNLFFNTKLYFFDYKKNGYRFPYVRVKITTPPKLRKLNNDQ